MHSLYKSVDKTPDLVSLNIAIITKTKNLTSPIRYVTIEYHKGSSGASKKDKHSYYTAIFTGVNSVRSPSVRSPAARGATSNGVNPVRNN